MKYSIYVIRHKNGSVLGFSDDPGYVYNYLKDYFKRYMSVVYDVENNKSRITIEEIKDKKEIKRYYIEYYEYQIAHFYHGIYLSFWEISEFNRIFEEYRLDTLGYIRSHAKIKLDGVRNNVSDIDLTRYLRKNLGMKYDSLLNHDRFIMELGENKVRELVNGYGISQEIYELNKSYKSKINDDK